LKGESGGRSTVGETHHGSAALYREIVARSGLPDLIAPGTIHRALADVGADPATATKHDYRYALSRLAARMRAYLPSAELNLRLALIKKFLNE
jgi:hypothetical protein